MTFTNRDERRDPVSPLLRLGTIFSKARAEADNGWIEVRDGGRIHGVQISRGAIADVVSDSMSADGLTVHEQASHLFSLPRPHVSWIKDQTCITRAPRIDPSSVVLRGVLNRKELFDPVQLSSRIPVQTLQIGPAVMSRLKELPLSSRELEFLYQLRQPTPISMILWKRGLNPHYAGALIMALNMMGLWQGQWEPGLLPRVTSAIRILRMIEQGAGAHELLNIEQTATEAEQDRAFRRMSLELHPDRLRNLGPAEHQMATRAFEAIGSAYQSVKSSRRKPAVGISEDATLGRIALHRKHPDNWASLLAEARTAQELGDYTRARTFALKAMNHEPPPGARRELARFISQSA